MSIGIFQLVIIVLLIVLLFGAGRVPRVMEDLGKGIRSFRKGLEGEDEKESAPKKIEASEKKDEQ